MGMAVPHALATRALEQVFARVVEQVERAFEEGAGGNAASPAPNTPAPPDLAILDRIVPRRHADLDAPPNAPAG